MRSTVALKAAMAISGLIMVLYLILHMYGNLRAFWGKDAFDTYAHHLRTFGQPMLPYAGLLWVIRVVLLVSVLVHIYCAVVLSKRAHAALGKVDGKRYQTTKNKGGVQRSYASFTLRWGGVVIVLFVIYHILNLTTGTIHPGGASDSPYGRLVNSFQSWWVVLSYAIAMLAIGFHLRHGLWSAFATLGINNSTTRRRRLNQTAIVISLVITIGFLMVPFSILFGWVS